MVKITLISIILLTGCASLPNKVDTQLVDIQTVECPKPVDIPQPYLPISSITNLDDDGTVVMKIKASLQSCMDYASQEKQALDFYRNLK